MVRHFFSGIPDFIEARSHIQLVFADGGTHTNVVLCRACSDTRGSLRSNRNRFTAWSTIRTDALQAVRMIRLVTVSTTLAQSIRHLAAHVDHEVQVEWIPHDLLPPHCKAGIAARLAASIPSPTSRLELNDATRSITSKKYLRRSIRALIAPCCHPPLGLTHA